MTGLGLSLRGELVPDEKAKEGPIQTKPRLGVLCCFAL